MDKSRNMLDDLTIENDDHPPSRRFPRTAPGRPATCRSFVERSAIPSCVACVATDAGLYPQRTVTSSSASEVRPEPCSSSALPEPDGCAGRDVSRSLTAGGVALLPPREEHAYGAQEVDPWTLEWAHFTGDEAGLWRATILGPKPDSVCLDLPPRSASAISAWRECTSGSRSATTSRNSSPRRRPCAGASRSCRVFVTFHAILRRCSRPSRRRPTGCANTSTSESASPIWPRGRGCRHRTSRSCSGGGLATHPSTG